MSRDARRSRLDRFHRAVWLYPAALALRIAEEAPGFTKWAQKHA